MKRALLISGFIISCSAFVYAQKKNLEISDFAGNRQFFTKPVAGLRSMADGKRYTEMVSNENTKATDIIIFDYRTGQTLDTLVRGNSLMRPGGNQPLTYSSYEINQSATQVLFTADEEHIYRHSTKANNYLYDVTKQTLTAVSLLGKQMYATISPDGIMAAFVRENNLYIRNMVTGEEKAITSDGKKNEIINGANDWVYEEEFSFSRSYQWSADGSKIAYYRFDERRVPEYTLTLYDNLYPTLEKYKYPKAGEASSLVDIFIYDVKMGKTVKADLGTETDQYIPRIKWTADPDKLSIQRLNRLQNKLDLLLCDAATGKTSILLTEENKAYVEIYDDLTFLNDRRHFIWTSNRDGYHHIYYYNMDGRIERQVTSGSWDVTAYYGCNEKTGTFYYQAAANGPAGRQVYSVTLKGKKQLLSANEGTSTAEFSSTFQYFMNKHTDANTPAVYTMHDASGRMIRMLQNNEKPLAVLAGYNLSKKEFFTFKTSEGVELYGWMIKPPDFDAGKKYPVLQCMYGGPTRQLVLDSYEGADYFWFQMLAEKGYVVACVDNRGTFARGDEFATCTYKNMGHLELLDQVEVAKYLESLPYVDVKRIGVYGWSYGGYLTSLLMTKGADHFKAGIAVAPVTNWRNYDNIYTERYLRTPQENPKGYDDNSPVNFAKQLKGKFLLVHGTADDNVHFQNSMEFADALIKEKKQFRSFFYPNKAHSMTGARGHVYQMLTDFIIENL